MKTLECRYCNKNLGEIEKGKIRFGAVLICRECFEKIIKTKQDKKPDISFLNDIFPGLNMK